MNASRIGLSASLFALVSLGVATAADWPGFRGAQFGRASEKDVPVSDSEDSILWKAKLPGPGASSPIVVNGKVFVTCYTGYGEKLTRGFTPPPGMGKDGKGPPPGDGKGPPPFDDGPDQGGDQKALRFQVLCLDAKQGNILWKYVVEPKLPGPKFAGMIRDHGYASSTPVTDGEHIFAFFGKTGVVCLDMQGHKVWQESVGPEIDSWGSASSPVLHTDLLIVNAAIESRSVVALDKKTGKEVWRAKGTGRSWSSPIVVKAPDGGDELVVSTVGKLVAYDPATGKELWHCEGIGAGGKGLPPVEPKNLPPGVPKNFPPVEPYTVTTPVARDGIVYLVGGGGPTRAIAMAVKAGGRGDVNSTHVLWRKNIAEALGSPSVIGNSLCWVNGVLTALDVKDGSPRAKERLCGNSVDYTSPVTVGTKLYALTRLDGLFVVDENNEFQTVAHLNFPEEKGVFNSTPAVSDGRLYARSNEFLYCVGKKTPE